MPAAGAELADLAGAAIEAALAVSRAEAAEHFSAAEVADVGLAVIGMGKCGARELNYISDVDVIYVIESGELDDPRANTIGTALASGISRAIMSTGREPGLWEVDANLRPEGKSGPLVRTLASHQSYYARWAESWEFQALLKARTIAGDAELGARYEAAVAPLIWSSAGREGFVESVRSMRRRVTEHIPADEEQRQIKLGRGGLRDVEFTVQLLQLVHGKSDEIAALPRHHLGHRRVVRRRLHRPLRRRRVRPRLPLPPAPRTPDPALPAAPDPSHAGQGSLAAGPRQGRAGTVLQRTAQTRCPGRGLAQDQTLRPRAARTHLLPPAAEHRRDAQQRGSQAHARKRPRGASPRWATSIRAAPCGTSKRSPRGVSRRAALQRQLLPILLGWLAEGVDPDAGLLAFRRVSEALGTTHWYLGMLRDSTAAAERLCHVLSNSRLIADLLEVSPESVAWLGSDKELVPLTFEAQWLEIVSKMSRHAEPESAMRLIRLIRRREILRIAIADSAGLLDQDQVGAALADTDRAAVLGALRVAETVVTAEEPLKTHVLVVAMGRQGGREIGYGSDADVMYVHRGLPGVPEEEAQQQALQIVGRLSSLLTQPLKPAILAERVLMVDADLRPEGKSGPMVRSLESYAEYYRRWSLVWEAQALLRARPMAGDDELAADFVALIDPIRYPESLSEQDVREVRRVKARVEAERLPRGADPARHLKLGRGGLSDVEWLAQLLQLQHAGKHPELRTTSTVEALEARCRRRAPRSGATS